MMRAVIYFFLVLVTQDVLSQTDTLSVDTGFTADEGEIPIDIFVGKKIFQNDFFGQLNTWNDYDLQEPVTLLGLGFSGQINYARAYQVAGHLALLFIVPQKIHIPNIGDGKITGYEVSVSGAGVDLFRSSTVFDLIFSAGINTGKIRVIGIPAARQRNLFLAPMAAICPRIILRHVSLALNVQYDYDITGSGWKRAWFAEHKKVYLGKFNQTGLTVFLCVGYAM